MRNPVRIAVAALVAFILLASGLLVLYRTHSQRVKTSRYESMDGWETISGRWNENAGVLSNSNYGRGDMLIAQNSQGSNYSVSADIRFDLLFPDTHYGDAGLVIRTTDPQQGVDSYQGYYAGLRPDQETIVLGRASYDWRQLATAPLQSPVSIGSWYRLELSAQGCTLSVTVTPEDGRSPTHLDYEDKQCLTTGVAGLRSFYAQASWRNVKVTPR